MIAGIRMMTKRKTTTRMKIMGRCSDDKREYKDSERAG